MKASSMSLERVDFYIKSFLANPDLVSRLHSALNLLERICKAPPQTSQDLQFLDRVVISQPEASFPFYIRLSLRKYIYTLDE